jgi:hypothetical protein
MVTRKNTPPTAASTTTSTELDCDDPKGEAGILKEACEKSFILNTYIG